MTEGWDLGLWEGGIRCLPEEIDGSCNNNYKLSTPLCVHLGNKMNVHYTQLHICTTYNATYVSN